MNDNSIALVKPEGEPVSMELFDLLRRQATELIRSGFLPAHIKTPEQAVAVILIGRELGIPMMYALRKVCVIQGTPTLAAELMVALARRTGEVEDLRVEDDGEKATVIVKRRGQPTPHVNTFSMADAKGLRLADKDNWTRQPRTMRQWRALSANLRVTFPDAIGGLYTPEEIAPDVRVDSQGMPAEAPAVAPAGNPFMPKQRPAGPPSGGATQGGEEAPDESQKADTGTGGAAEPVPTAPAEIPAAVPEQLTMGTQRPMEGITFELRGREVTTRGATKEQMLKIYKLRPILDTLVKPGTAKEILGRDFGVEHAHELGEKQAAAYIAELSKAINRAEAMRKK